LKDLKQPTTKKIIPYIIGDIHGCFETYKLLEKKISTHAKKLGSAPFVISVGDLIDRGGYSFDVVDHFVRGNLEGTHIALLGNHEVELLKNIYAVKPSLFDNAKSPFPWYLDTFDTEYVGDVCNVMNLEEYKIFQRIHWYFQGGVEALKSYRCDPKEPRDWNFPIEHIRFLSNMPLLWENESIVVTHGFAKGHDLEHIKCFVKDYSAEKPPSDPELRTTYMESVHNAIWSRRPPHIPVYEKRLHISGHTPVQKVRRMPSLNELQIDTGCVYGRRLTAYCTEVDQVISVKSIG